MIRVFIVGIAALALAGCGSESTEPAPSSPAETAVEAVSDEQQIRDLIDAEEAAMAGFDFDTMAGLTCARYRDVVVNQPDTMFPPISEAGTPEELAAKPVDMLTEALKQQYPTASDATIRELVDALVRYDEPAYKAANLEILRQTTTVTIDKVENIKVTGDTATADLTTTWRSGNEPPVTETQSNSFLKEDGKWLDCEEPVAE
ncbi:Rv0361 family membrane protein [Mycolicibacterium houstonense]|uniref:Rv0361 family membrane protein n=1 Tax=Mycolicibacterium houstonense TaxID=146021 RepID=UPI003F9BF5A1